MTFFYCFNNSFTPDTGTPGKISLSLMRLIVERHFILDVPFIFSVPLIVPHKAELFLTSLSTVLNLQPLPWRALMLVISTLIKNKELSME